MGGVLAAQTDARKPFPFSVRNIAEGSPIDCSFLNGGPLGPASRISVSTDGHLIAAGKRIRVFGMNMTSLPSKEEAPELARRLSCLGINMIRFHHMDAPWSNALLPGTYSESTRKIDPAGLDRLDYFISECGRRGIYADVNLLVGRYFNSKDGLPAAIDGVGEWKARHALGFFSKDVFSLQMEYAKALLTHVNPYTGLPYATDPRVAVVELNNENGLIMAYLNGWIDEMPESLIAPLEDQWTAWLKPRSASPAGMLSEFALSAPRGDSLIRPEDDGWNLETHEASKATLKRDGTTFEIDISKPGSESWHIQLAKSRLSVKPGKIYTVSFKAKANAAAVMGVSLGMAHDPWQSLGFSKEIKLERAWKTYEFAFGGVTGADENARLLFSGMGKLTGVFDISDISLREGGELLKLSKSGGITAVPLPSFSDYGSLPEGFRRLVMEFLYEREKAYWASLRNYLKQDLGVQALLMGTISGCAPTGLMAEFDIVDSHAYWNHPVFPGTDWDMGNYYVWNKSLIRSDSGGTLSGLARRRVYGKPFSVSEYDHPYPNRYSAEMWPMIASFASFQDWDMLFGFCLEGDAPTATGEFKIGSYFDQSHNPAKTPAQPFAALMFRQGLLQPGKTAVYARLDLSTEKADLVRASAWNIGDPAFIGLGDSMALRHRVGIVWDGETAGRGMIPENGMTAAASASESAGRANAGFDTGEISWDFQSGTYVVDAPDVFAYAGFGEAAPRAKQAACGLSFSPRGGFSVAAIVRRHPGKKWIAFACSGSGNIGETVREYGTVASPVRENGKITTLGSLGQGPAFALAASGSFKLGTGTGLSVSPLDPRGKPKKSRGGRGELPILAEDESVWWEIRNE